MGWHDAADPAELTEGAVIGRVVAGRRIALYRLEGAYFATSDLCTHGNAPLSRGEVVDGHVECPAHYGLFEIRTGRAAGAPVSRDLRTYPARLANGRVEVEIEEDAG